MAHMCQAFYNYMIHFTQNAISMAIYFKWEFVYNLYLD